MMFRNKLELLKKENDLAENGLDFDLRAKIEEMVKYVWAKGAGAYEAQVFRKDMISMAKDAEAREQSFEDCLGMDCLEFCDSVAEASQGDSTEKVLSIFYKAAAYLLFVAAAQILLYPFDKIPISWFFLLGMPIFFIILSIVGILEPRFRGFKGIKRMIPNIISGGSLLLLFVWSLASPRGNIEIIAYINWIYWVLIHLALFLIARLLWSRHMNQKASLAETT